MTWDDEEYDADGYEDDHMMGCVFPGKCLMPGEHLESECHTVEMIEAMEAENGSGE